MENKIEKKADINYNIVETESTGEDSIKLKIMSPLQHNVIMNQNTWDYHVMGDHPDRVFYDNTFNFEQIMSVLSQPRGIFDDKDFASDCLRLNYIGSALIKNNGKLKLKHVKIVTEEKGVLVANYKDVRKWPKEEFVTAFIQSNMSEDFSERRNHYV